MIERAVLERLIVRAGLAPTVHNTQPARWRRDGDGLMLLCDTDVGLTVGDPTGRDAALSCGAVLEAFVLAASSEGYAAKVMLTGNPCKPGQGLVAVAHLTFVAGSEDGLHNQLEQRFTWRGPFGASAVDLYGWNRPDTRLVLDRPGRAFLAQQNDWASHDIMGDRRFRHELVSWMRLSHRHPRAGLDGMDRGAMRMSGFEAMAARLTLLKLWPLMERFGVSRGIVREQDVTLTAPVIALFHRQKDEDPVASGRAYLRMCLEAASLGLAGWPMAALSDHPQTYAEVCARFALTDDRRLIQAIRFGVPTGEAPARARRPLDEVFR